MLRRIIVKKLFNKIFILIFLVQFFDRLLGWRRLSPILATDFGLKNDRGWWRLSPILATDFGLKNDRSWRRLSPILATDFGLKNDRGWWLFRPRILASKRSSFSVSSQRSRAGDEAAAAGGYFGHGFRSQKGLLFLCQVDEAGPEMKRPGRKNLEPNQL